MRDILRWTSTDWFIGLCWTCLIAHQIDWDSFTPAHWSVYFYNFLPAGKKNILKTCPAAWTAVCREDVKRQEKFKNAKIISLPRLNLHCFDVFTRPHAFVSRSASSLGNCRPKRSSRFWWGAISWGSNSTIRGNSWRRAATRRWEVTSVGTGCKPASNYGSLSNDNIASDTISKLSTVSRLLNVPFILVTRMVCVCEQKLHSVHEAGWNSPHRSAIIALHLISRKARVISHGSCFGVDFEHFFPNQSEVKPESDESLHTWCSWQVQKVHVSNRVSFQIH